MYNINKTPMSVLGSTSTCIEHDYLLNIVCRDAKIKFGILEVIQEWVVSILGSCFCGQTKLLHER